MKNTNLIFPLLALIFGIYEIIKYLTSGCVDTPLHIDTCGTDALYALILNVIICFVIVFAYVYARLKSKGRSVN